MDAAESIDLRGALSAQGRFVGVQEACLGQVAERVYQLSSDLAQVTALLSGHHYYVTPTQGVHHRAREV